MAMNIYNLASCSSAQTLNVHYFTFVLAFQLRFDNNVSSIVILLFCGETDGRIAFTEQVYDVNIYPQPYHDCHTTA